MPEKHFMNRLYSFNWPLAFAGMSLLAAGLAWKLHVVSRTLGNTFSYDCTIKAVDSETYKPLKIMAANGPAQSSKDLFNQSYSTAFTPEGALEIAGIGYEPRKLGIVVDGYHAIAVTITSETPSLVEVPMKRTSAVAK
jgi:hypothetical protein